MGPLAGLKIVELFCIGPGPFAGMLLSDMGADVVLVDRMEEMELGYPDHPYRFLYRNRRSVQVDLKSPEGRDAVLRMVEEADGLIEGFRPGVAERLGLGPDECLARNPRLVYGRMTGWGQQGPLAQRAGFDANFLSVTGALWAIGEADRPPMPPLIMAGDFGGGGVFLAMGMVAAMFEASRSGQGQVIDAAIADGALNLMAYVYGNLAGGTWVNERQSNLIDGGDWRYGTYRCADGKYVSTALLQPKFLRSVREKAGLDLSGLGDPADRANWPAYRARLGELFATRTRDEWAELFDGPDDTVMPVLDLEEAPRHPQNVDRGAFVEVDGTSQPAPAPRFSRTASEVRRVGPRPGQGGDEALSEWGFSAEELARLRKSGAIG
ncbi:MAG: CoA transferase [Acidimicrobiia bacterium]|nr:CoA transferase [Acidimicrobiia bacterium]